MNVTDCEQAPPASVWAAPEKRSQARQELIKLERLGEVIVSARVQPNDPVADTSPGAQDQDRSKVTELAQAAAGSQAVCPWKHNVQDYDTGLQRAPHHQRGLRRRGHGRLVILIRQPAPKVVGETRVVLDNQNSPVRRRSRGWRRVLRSCHRRYNRHHLVSPQLHIICPRAAGQAQFGLRRLAHPVRLSTRTRLE